MIAPTLDLRKAARRAPIPALDLGAIDARDLEAARSNWRQRMASEHASARVFGELVGGMMRASLPAEEIRRVVAMAEQELDHGVLCASVLVALGTEPVADMPRLDPIPAHEDAATPLEAVLRNVISIGCCSETVAVALVATEREQAGPPAVAHVLDRILRDEIKHSRFGWRTLGRHAPRLTTRERDGLDEYLVDAFAHQLDFHGQFLGMPYSSSEGIAIGAPHGGSSWNVFTTTMDHVVIPGLTQCGLRAREAWEAARATFAACVGNGSAAEH
ncbi:MAG: ferritin-like domain-containing protein [Deltaproteobacteria bacterium]|nr:ferritin-like domain-containing protein [Deltaproteobacteria bacterium]